MDSNHTKPEAAALHAEVSLLYAAATLNQSTVSNRLIQNRKTRIIQTFNFTVNRVG